MPRSDVLWSPAFSRGLHLRVRWRPDISETAQVIEAGKATQWASAESGTITVSKNGDDYTVSWDLTSDAGCKVTGSYTGPIDIIL